MGEFWMMRSLKRSISNRRDDGPPSATPADLALDLTITEISFHLNGRQVVGSYEPRNTLADVLRSDRGATSVKIGCQTGHCGSCLVLVDGSPALSCLVLCPQAIGTRVTTLEGLVTDPRMTVLRHAFHLHHAVQCGFCTPAMLLATHDLLIRRAALDDSTIREELAGQLCRCTGYVNIVRAVRAASDLLAGEASVTRE